ncbi:MAG: hypothetical protein LBD55_01830, partial [Treponema sp.]|nr:hypothetical protein [Treponema sp.]
MKRLKKIEKLIISGFLGVLLALAAGCPDPAGGGSADFVPVAGITGVPAAGVKNSPVDLSKAAVSPAGATNKTILWSVAEGSAVKADADGAVFTPKEAGTLTLSAAVKNGLSEKTDYTEEFTLTVSAGHVPVTGITGVPSGGVKGAVIDLSKAAVSPAG